MINKNDEPPFLAARQLTLVRVVGVEPTRLAAQEPKGDVTTVICFCLQKIDDYLDPKIT